MKKGNDFLYWLPRILAIVFILFISVFALDVFDSSESVGEVLLALLMHLIPSFVLIIATWIAWKRENLGGSLFILLGIGFTFFFGTYDNAWTFGMLSLPLFAVGILFIWQGMRR